MATIADILMAQGRLAGESRARRGTAWTPLVEHLAQLPGAIIAQRDAEKVAQAREAERLQDRARAQAIEAQQYELGEQQIAEGAHAATSWQRQSKLAEIVSDPSLYDAEGMFDKPRALSLAKQKGYTDLGADLDKYDNEHDAAVFKRLTAQQEHTAALNPAKKTREIKVRHADGSESIQIVEDTPGQSFSSAAPPEDEVSMVIKGPGGRPMRVLVPKSQLRNGGMEEYREPKADAGLRSPIWVVGPDGKFRDLAGVAPPGSSPASSREQGRPVTSGDAGRFAELQTSLDDLKTLRGTLFPDADLNTGDAETDQTTGTLAAIGAGMWNPITELTGWGADAKSRQGVIDRVKQVIGKALEGGVLRKEDEEKYKKILPTIRDVPSVAKDKLDGLEKAIQQRLQREIEARQDAGYDVSKFQQRGGQPSDTDPLGLGF